jgi:hypothetical protein
MSLIQEALIYKQVHSADQKVGFGKSRNLYIPLRRKSVPGVGSLGNLADKTNIANQYVSGNVADRKNIAQPPPIVSEQVTDRRSSSLFGRRRNIFSFV